MARNRSQDSYTTGLINAEKDGRADAERGIPIGSNPFHRSDFRKSWEAGWRDGNARLAQLQSAEATRKR